jgi:hypothetical protein
MSPEMTGSGHVPTFATLLRHVWNAVVMCWITSPL